MGNDKCAMLETTTQHIGRLTCSFTGKLNDETFPLYLFFLHTMNSPICMYMYMYSTSQKKVKVGYYKYSTLTLRSALVYARSCACVRRKYVFEYA